MMHEACSKASPLSALGLHTAQRTFAFTVAVLPRICRLTLVLVCCAVALVLAVTDLGRVTLAGPSTQSQPSSTSTSSSMTRQTP